MPTGYPSKAVANWVLDYFERGGRDCTQLQLNKLVFIAHGWHLAWRPKHDGLICEPVFAWKHGPVIPSLREEFRDFGSKPITRKASVWVDDEFEYYEPKLEDSEPEPWETKLLQWVCEQYGRLSGPALISLTHREGSPWATVTKNGTDIGHNRIIPTERIREHYLQLKAQMEEGKV